jgi:hypothetical protein
MSLRILVEYHQNSDCVSIHVDQEISQSNVERFLRPLRPESSKYLGKLGKLGSTITQRLFEFHGVEELSVYPYKIFITKGKAFRMTQLVRDAIHAIGCSFIEDDPMLWHSPHPIDIDDDQIHRTMMVQWEDVYGTHVMREGKAVKAEPGELMTQIEPDAQLLQAASPALENSASQLESETTTVSKLPGDTVNDQSSFFFQK